MGDVSMNGFNGRAAALLNKKTFSDVEIQVRDGITTQVFPAHKLFLAMSSQEFADLLYGADAPPTTTIKILDYRPHVVYLMLQFIYTDSTDTLSPEEMKELFRLAKKFAIVDLERYCLKKLFTETTSIRNLFEKYEFALSENISHAIKCCRDIVSLHTMDVLRSPKFCSASREVVEDILRMDDLSVENELELIEAAIRWAEQESVRRSEKLRICLYPLFKHLRFLTLTPDQFSSIVEKHNDILNAPESMLITMLLFKSSSNARLPAGFSDNPFSRKYPKLEVNSRETKNVPLTNDTSKIDNVALFASFGSEASSSRASTLDYQMRKQMENLYQDAGRNTATQKVEVSSKDYSLKENKTVSSANNTSKVNENASFSTSIQAQIQELSKDLILSHQDRRQSSTIHSVEVPSKKRAETDDFVFKFKSEAFQKLNGTSIMNNKFSSARTENREQPLYEYSSAARKIETSRVIARKTNTFLPTSSSGKQWREFEFPLQSMEKSFSTVFETDVSCSADVQLYKGSIELHGVELKIKEKPGSESITAFVTLSTPQGNHADECSCLLRNGKYEIMFFKPQRLTEGNHMKINVVVEELALSRCLGCDISDTYHLNCGLGVSAEVTLESNHSAEPPCSFYLISKLLYKLL